MSKIEIKDLNFIYSKGTTSEFQALDNVNLAIDSKEFVAIIGHTGSGKSTLIQQINGLIKPDSGQVLYDGKDINEKGFNRRELRGKVGLVFQYPEYQLFEETVLKDVAFGPKNKGLSDEDALAKAKEALEMVGIKEKYFEMSPFDLSGGQKRRVAIAGVLAMEPEILILDEPTAGLDPEGRDRILERVNKLHEDHGIGVVLVTHSMDDVAKYADRIIVMSKGKIAMEGATRDVFSDVDRLEEIGLGVPQISYIMKNLKDAGLNVDTTVISLEEAKRSIKGVL
ncbi:MAG: energy-coupling factor transporter ATPase [Eubacterium sp.]|nr:energy-coupling factor transporter ATPase [Eubacterium sp.]